MQNFKKINNYTLYEQMPLGGWKKNRGSQASNEHSSLCVQMENEGWQSSPLAPRGTQHSCATGYLCFIIRLPVTEFVTGFQPSQYASFNLDHSCWRPRLFSLILPATLTDTFRSGMSSRGKALSICPALPFWHKWSSWKLVRNEPSLSHANVAQSPTFP